MPSTSEKPHSLLPRNSANQVIGGGSRLKPSHCFGPDRLDSLDRWCGQRHLARTTASLTAQAATHLLATAQGAYLKIEGGNIELHAPGKVEFQASMKDWTGPASASYGELRLPDGEFELPKLDPALRSLQWQLHAGLDGELQADVPYQIVSDGVIVAEGLTDSSGQTQRHDEVDLYKPAEVWFGESAWTVQLEPDEDGPPAPLDEQIYDDEDEDDAAEA